MAMLANKNGEASEINVTPLIDILLVLLIIFMVIVPVAPKGLAAFAPLPAKPNAPEGPSEAIVVSVLHGLGAQVLYKINQVEVAKADLPARLTSIYATRAERVMFIKGDDEVPFSQVAEVIGMGRSAGVDHVGLMTPAIIEGR